MGMKVLVRGGVVDVSLFTCFDFASVLGINIVFSAPGVFSMDEDSLSRDCEPFFESDGEEESTDGESLPC